MTKRTAAIVGLWILVCVPIALVLFYVEGPDTPSPPHVTAEATTDAPTATHVDPWDICRQPTNKEQIALYAAVTRDSKHLREPWAAVRHANTVYIAGTLHLSGFAHPLVILVRYPASADPLATMRAVNGTAQDYTNLPPADSIGRAGQEALNCVNAP